MEERTEDRGEKLDERRDAQEGRGEIREDGGEKEEERRRRRKGGGDRREDRRWTREEMHKSTCRSAATAEPECAASAASSRPVSASEAAFSAFNSPCDKTNTVTVMWAVSPSTERQHQH